MFDFGLAKELKQKDERLDGLYELTGNTGSRRYMAPEVGLDECYNKSVDVYSFGILLWEMCAAETPFHGYNSAKHMELVVMGGERPSMDAHHTAAWPMNLQWLMNRCWSATPVDRPTFTAIKKVLLEVRIERERAQNRLVAAVVCLCVGRVGNGRAGIAQYRIEKVLQRQVCRQAVLA